MEVPLQNCLIITEMLLYRRQPNKKHELILIMKQDKIKTHLVANLQKKTQCRYFCVPWVGKFHKMPLKARFVCKKMEYVKQQYIVLQIIVWTHWSRVMPYRRQAIILTNAGILSVHKLGTNISENRSEIEIFLLMKMHLKCRLRNGVHFFSASLC